MAILGKILRNPITQSLPFVGAAARTLANVAPKGTGARIANKINTLPRTWSQDQGITRALVGPAYTSEASPQTTETNTGSTYDQFGPLAKQYATPIGGTDGGSVLGTGTSNTSSGGDSGQNNIPLQQQPSQPDIDFDALIAPALQGLEAAIGPLQQGFAGYQSGQQANQATQLAGTNQNIGAQGQALESGRIRQQQGGESAIDEARRGFSEIQQGLQARYGKTTGTGQFASELAGRETFGNIANIRQGLSQAMLEIDNKLQQVKEIGRIAVEDLNNKTQDRIAQAKNQLDLGIADIRRQQGVLQSDKARLAAQAIQWYQGEVNRVNSENSQFLQGLYTQQKNAEQQLQLANQKAKQAAESFSVYNLSKGGQTTPVRVGNRGTVQDFQGSPVNVGSGSTLFRPGTLGQEDELTNPFSGG